MKKVFSLSLFLLITISLFAQKAFEGTIVYETSINGEGLSMMAGMMPSSYTLQVLGSDSRAEMAGGMMSSMFGAFIYKGVANETYMLKPAEKTAYKMDPQQTKKDDSKPVITDMKKTQQIAGYTCNQYRFSMVERGTQTTVDVWTTKEITCKVNTNPALESLFYEGIEGLPLMVEMTMNLNGTDASIVYKATTVKEEKLAASLFEIPAGYQIKPYKNPMGK